MKYRAAFYVIDRLHRWSVKKLRKLINSKHKYEKNGQLTDHALLRYIERKNLVDIEFVRQSIMTKEVYKKIKEIGGYGKFVYEGMAYVIKDGMVITMYVHTPTKPVKIVNGIRKWSF